MHLCRVAFGVTLFEQGDDRLIVRSAQEMAGGVQDERALLLLEDFAADEIGAERISIELGLLLSIAS